MQLRCPATGRLAQPLASSCRPRSKVKPVTRRRALVLAAARSTGREEREQALQQQWQEAGGDEGADYEGAQPYGNPYYQQYPAYPLPYTPKAESSGGLPYGWILFGVAAGFVITKVMDFFSPSGGGPQAKMMNFMMKQAMKGSGPGAAGAPPGFPDFSQLGGQAGFPPGFPGAGFPTPPSSSGSSSRASSAAVDTTARTVQQKPASEAAAESSSAAAPSSSSAPGAKFEEMKSRNRRRRRGGEDAGSQASAGSAGAAFVDTEVEEAAASAQPAGGASSSGNGAASGKGEEEDDEFTLSMLESFLADPAMQEMLYQYLPEPMRNRETFEWMLQNPEYREQLKSVLKAQGAQLNKDVYKQMQGVDNEEMRAQLAAHGITPAEVVQKIMGEPELAAAFSKPAVQQAVMEMQSNPMAIVKYQNDPDVMLVLEKMSQMFPEAGPGGPAGVSGMPGAPAPPSQ